LDYGRGNTSSFNIHCSIFDIPSWHMTNILLSNYRLQKNRRNTCHSRPHPALRFDPEALGLKEYSREFFRLDTAHIAREILGAWFARRYRNQWYGARIAETEAYLGSMDAAAHSRRGRRTPRVEPMYQDGGHLYVFFVYGMHHCANVVTRPAGIAEAILLRAAESPEGAPLKLLSGPGRLCAALGITAKSSGFDLLSGGNLRLFQAERVEDVSIGVSKRIGVDYAGEAADWPLRFFVRNSPAVSGPARLNKMK
jgi:DNA-3-methyladenine glycosylase